jgi:APA family basic amino acid/polyamine antiporter
LTTPDSDSQTQGVSLKRSITLPLITLYGLGNIIGAGIYVLIGKVAAHAGMFAPVSFLVASLLACLTAFTYAEMSARYPYSAGEAVYLQMGFAMRWLSLLVGLLIVFAGIVSAAAIARGFTGYLQVLIAVPAPVAIVTLVVVLAGLAIWGVSESVTAAAVITVAEAFGLLLILWVASPGPGQLAAQAVELVPPADGVAWQGILLGGFLAFYAFIGFEDMVNVAEEVRNPLQNLPRAILLALGISALLYIMVSVVAVTAVAPEQLAESNAPLAYIYSTATGKDPLLISLISIFAIVNGALIQIIMATRILYGLSSQHWLPRFFGSVNPQTRTPINATVIVALLVMVMALWLPIETLAGFTSLFILTVFALVNGALWRIKTREAEPPAVFRTQLWVPVAGCLCCCAFVLFHLFTQLG